MTVDAGKLVQMAEQITANLNYTDDEVEVGKRVADHLRRFWDPRMKAALLDHARDAQPALSAPLRLAIRTLETD